MSRFSLTFFLFLIFLNSVQITNAEVLKWVDENGKMNFSDKPHNNATPLDLRPPKPAGIGISKKQTQRRNELLEQFAEKKEAQQKQALQNKKRQEEIDRYCTSLKNQLRNYKEADYLFSRDKNGQKQNLTDQQKISQENKLRELIKERC